MFNKLVSIYKESDIVMFWAFVTAFSLAITIIISWIIMRPILPSQIPLFYSLSWGQSQLGSIDQYLILPAMVFLIALSNLIICWHLHESQKTMKRILSVSTAVTAILITITAFEIIFIFV